MDFLDVNHDSEKQYRRGDFLLTVKWTEFFLYFSAFEERSCQLYCTSITNQTISEVSNQLFQKISEFYRFFIENYETKGKEQGVIVKFNKKEVQIIVKIDFTMPIKKTLGFSLPLKPQGGTLMMKSLRFQIEELNQKADLLEKKSENFVGLGDLASLIGKLEGIIGKKDGFSGKKDHFNAKNNNIVLNSGKKETNKKENNNNVEPQYSFNSVLSEGFYKFKEKNTKISRNSQVKKQHILCWGSKGLLKLGIQRFSIRIDKINEENDQINACIGVMIDEMMGKITNLADHTGSGCYLFGLNSQFLWVNNEKTAVAKKIGKIGDIIEIIINFNEEKISWNFEGECIGEGKLDSKQIKEFGFYPVVTLSCTKESLSFVQ